MDDLSIFGKLFNWCGRDNLEKVLKRRKDTNLLLNCEKFLFMVQEIIVSVHHISKTSIEVDKAKTKLLSNFKRQQISKT